MDPFPNWYRYLILGFAACIDDVIQLSTHANIPYMCHRIIARHDVLKFPLKESYYSLFGVSVCALKEWIGQ